MGGKGNKRRERKPSKKKEGSQRHFHLSGLVAAERRGKGEKKGDKNTNVRG